MVEERERERQIEDWQKTKERETEQNDYSGCPRGRQLIVIVEIDCDDCFILNSVIIAGLIGGVELWKGGVNNRAIIKYV